MVHQVLTDCKVGARKVIVASQDVMVSTVRPVFRVPKVIQACQVNLVCLVCLVNLVSQPAKVTKVIKANVVILAAMVSLDLKVKLAFRV